MGLIESWNNYHNRVGEAVGGAANVASQNSAIAAAVVGAMCNIASKYPATWAAPPYARGWVNGACGDSGLDGFPPPPPVPQGGQCPEFYEVDYSVYVSSGQEFSRTKTVQGPIISIFLAAGNVFLRTLRGDPPQEAVFSFDPGGGQYTELEVKAYRLTDGGEDLCGDSPEHYPPDPPPDPDDFNFGVTFGDGTSLSVSLEGDISGAPGLTFSGDGVSISVGGDGISVDVDGGVAEGGGSAEEEDFDAENFEPEPGEETEEESQVDPAIAWVVVRVTQDPPSRKIITFTDAQDRHMFAGYFCWTVSLDDQQYHLPYKTITKPYNAYKAPVGATGYRAYTTNGAKIQTVVYKERTEE